MIIFGKPKNELNYICVDSEGCIVLHELGFQPVYRWMSKIYFTKTNEIVEVIKQCNLKTK
jgi:hypothetical protein